MKLTRETALIEAVLFLESEPVEIQAISKILKLAPEAVRQGLDVLKQHYSSDTHGLDLVQIGGGYLLIPKNEYWDTLRDRYGQKNSNRLSRAALETLSIIAYSQPITRSEIENIRGVSADGMIRILSEKNLVKQVGKKDAPGKPVQYGTTKEFLKLFRLNSISDLPSLSDIEKDRFELED